MPTSCVFRRSGNDTLYVRVFIPARLQAVFKGKAEIVRSLDTSDPSIADLRARVVHGRAASLFLHASRFSSTMDKTQIRILIAKYIDDRLDEWEESVSMSGLNIAVNGEWQDCLSSFAQSTVDDSEASLRSNGQASPDLVQEFVERYKVKMDGERDKVFLGRELLKAERVIAGKIKQRAQGDYGSEYNGGGGGSVAPSANLDRGLATDAPVSDPSPSLSEVIPAYLKHYEHRAPGTLEAKRNVLKRFAEIIGADKPVSSIKKADCVAYRETLRKLPPNVSKRFPGLSLRQIIEKVKELPEVVMLSKVTINQDLTHLTHFFSWLINEGQYTGASNPVNGIQYEGVESESHEEFTDADLKVIFASKEYLAQRDVEPARYWLPVILAYTGARREEIAHLALTNIRQEEGVSFFDIKPELERGRRIKNKASKRKVPVHSQLVKLGFLKYVEKRRAVGETLLFSKKSTEKGRATPGDAVSKWFSRLLKKLRIPGHKSIHGLRSTVNTKLHELRCDPETRRGLLGHGGVDVNETVYLRLSLKTLSENLERLRYSF